LRDLIAVREQSRRHFREIVHVGGFGEHQVGVPERGDEGSEETLWAIF